MEILKIIVFGAAMYFSLACFLCAFMLAGRVDDEIIEWPWITAVSLWTIFYGLTLF